MTAVLWGRAAGSEVRMHLPFALDRLPRTRFDEQHARVALDMPAWPTFRTAPALLDGRDAAPGDVWCFAVVTRSGRTFPTTCLRVTPLQRHRLFQDGNRYQDILPYARCKRCTYFGRWIAFFERPPVAAGDSTARPYFPPRTQVCLLPSGTLRFWTRFVGIPLGYRVYGAICVGGYVSRDQQPALVVDYPHQTLDMSRPPG